MSIADCASLSYGRVFRQVIRVNSFSLWERIQQEKAGKPSPAEKVQVNPRGEVEFHGGCSVRWS